MKHIIRFVTALFLAASITGSIQAQEAAFVTLTPVPTQTAPDVASTPVVAPVVVTETPEATDVDMPSLLDRLTPEHLIIVVLVIALIYQQVKTQTLIPASVVTTVIQELRKSAQRTETPLDNAAVDMLEAVVKPITATSTFTGEKPMA